MESRPCQTPDTECPEERETSKKSRRGQLRGLFGAGQRRKTLMIVGVVLYVLLVAAGMAPIVKARPYERFAVLATMGSGTVALTHELRQLGLDVSHESTDGADGSIGWLHSLLYLPSTAQGESEPLCDSFVRGAWHPQLLALPMERELCGEDDGGELKSRNAGSEKRQRSRKCWTKHCREVVDAWRGCAGAEKNCLVRFAKVPVLSVRHPLEAIDSLAGAFCPRRNGSAPAAGVAQLVAAARLLPDLQERPELSCKHGFARYWLEFHTALLPHVGEGWVRREDHDAACQIVRRVVASRESGEGAARAAAGLERAAWLCDGGASSWSALFFAPLTRFRFKVHHLFQDAFSNQLFVDKTNRRAKSTTATRKRTDWAELRRMDAQLAADLQKLAHTFGYALREHEAAPPPSV